MRAVAEVPLGRLPLRPQLEGQGTSDKVLLAKDLDQRGKLLGEVTLPCDSRDVE